MHNLFDEVDTAHCEYLDDYTNTVALEEVVCEEGLQRSAVYNED
jgi:hypothetical protein